MTARIVKDGQDGRAAAVEALRHGGLVALPTDTVYGLAVALSTADGLERLFAAKRRPLDKGIVLLLEEPDQAWTAGLLTPAAVHLARRFWPGGLTLVVPQRPDVPWPAALTGGAATIGLRVPDHDAPRALAREIGPLPTTSANISGLPELSDAPAIVDAFGDAIDLVLDGGPARGGPASTVVDCSGERPVVVREGAIGRSELAAALDEVGIAHDLG